jgi:hypothetical protein
MAAMISVTDVLEIIDTRIGLHKGRTGRLAPSDEDYQRTFAWHSASINALTDLRAEIMKHLEDPVESGRR